MPKFSIIIPCYNNADTVAAAIESALEQDYKDYNVYICDNASTDGSREVISQYSHDRLKINLYDEGMPKSENWNRAYTNGLDSEYLVTLHADDKLHRGALSSIDRHAKDKPSLIHGGFHIVGADGERINDKKFPINYKLRGDQFREICLMGNIVAVPAATIRTDAFVGAGMWSTRWTFLQDQDLWLDLAGYGHVSYVSEYLGDYRVPALRTHSWAFLKEALLWQKEKSESLQSPILREAATARLIEMCHQLAASQECRIDRKTAPEAALTCLDIVESYVRRPKPTGLGCRQKQRLLRLKYGVANKFVGATAD